MRTRSLIAEYGIKPYLVCPDCGSKYTTDRKTKRRAGLIAIFALITAAVSTEAALLGFPFGLVALVAGAGLLLFVGYTLSQVTYVKYHGKG